MADLGTVDGDPNSEAFVVNSRRQVVGATQDDNFSYVHAFLWERGSMADLNALIVPADLSVQLNAAVGLNERGEIVAQGTLPSGDQHAYLLVPCDENHGNVDGCDYSLDNVSGLVNATPQIPIAQRAKSQRDITGEFLRSLQRRSKRWYRARNKQPQN